MKQTETQILTKETLYSHWASGVPVTHKNCQYRVSKMSYGQHFLEPIGWTGGETDGFSPGTIWLERIPKSDLYQEE